MEGREKSLKVAQWLYRQQVAVNKVIDAVRQILEGEDGEAAQRELVQVLFEDHVTNQFPVSVRFRGKVAKACVEILERKGREVEALLYDLVLSSLQHDSLEKDLCYVSFGFVYEEESICSIRVDGGPLRKVGLLPWEAGMMLAEYAAAHRGKFAGKRVLELGAGVGLTGIVISKLCKVARITLTDFDEEVMENLAHNVAVNGCNPSVVDTKTLDWTCKESIQGLGEYDTLLVADCVYAPELVPPLLDLVRKVLERNPDGSAAWFVTTERNEKTFATFVEQLACTGISVTEISGELPETTVEQGTAMFAYDNMGCMVHKTIDKTKVRFFLACLYSEDSRVARMERRPIRIHIQEQQPPKEGEQEQADDDDYDDESSVERFTQFMEANKPCIVQETVLEPCSSMWTKNTQGQRAEINVQGLVARFGKSVVPVVGNKCDICHRAWNLDKSQVNPETADCIKVPLEEYFACWEQHGAEKCGYLKDWHAVAEAEQDGVRLYTTPVYFRDDWLNWWFLTSTKPEKDSAQAEWVTGASDYRFVYCGPRGSRTGLHHDVFRSYSWSVNVVGTKLWVLFPPEQERQVAGKTFPSSLCDAALSWFDAKVSATQGRNPTEDGELRSIVRQALANEGVEATFLVAVQHAGEAIFVPSGWYHLVVNLEDTLSVNHNWLNRYCFCPVMEFFRAERERTRESLMDCQRKARDGTWEDDNAQEEWRNLVNRIMTLNVGMSFDCWVKVVRAKTTAARAEMDKVVSWAARIATLIAQEK